MPKYLSKAECHEILRNQYVAKLGYVSGSSPFIVPITYFYYEAQNCVLALSAEGHKIDGMRINKTVCLYVDEIHSVKKWKSILMHGVFEELDADIEFYLKKLGEGIRSLLKIKKQKSIIEMDEFSNMKLSMKNLVMYRIRIWDITGRYME